MDRAAADATSADAPWKLLFDRDDDVTKMDGRGQDFFLLSHKDAPTYKVLGLRQASRFESTCHRGGRTRSCDRRHSCRFRRALCFGPEGGVFRASAWPTDSDKIETIDLPIKGHIPEAFTDPRKPGSTSSVELGVRPRDMLTIRQAGNSPISTSASTATSIPPITPSAIWRPNRMTA